MIPGFHAFGKLYISKRDYAIHKMAHALYDKLKFNLNKVNRKNNINELIFEVLTEYKEKGAKMFLNYISFHNSFQLGRSR